MRIHCLCVVKNEDDILAEVVEKAAVWADTIFIVDNMSTDGTPQVIRSLAERFPNVRDLGVYRGKFTDGIRGDLFNDDRVKSVDTPQAVREQGNADDGSVCHGPASTW